MLRKSEGTWFWDANSLVIRISSCENLAHVPSRFPFTIARWGHDGPMERVSSGPLIIPIRWMLTICARRKRAHRLHGDVTRMELGPAQAVSSSAANAAILGVHVCAQECTLSARLAKWSEGALMKEAPGYQFRTAPDFCCN
jgi:hypothetical protein